MELVDVLGAIYAAGGFGLLVVMVIVLYEEIWKKR